MIKNIKILVMGLPGSGKTTLSDKLAEIINASRVNADIVRKKYNDWDFSVEGRIRQAERMKNLTDNEQKKNHVIADFICPTQQARKKFNADYVIWMNTIKKGRFEDTNKLFEIPKSSEVNFEVKEKNADKIKFEIKNDLKFLIKF